MQLLNYCNVSILIRYFTPWWQSIVFAAQKIVGLIPRNTHTYKNV